MAIAAEPIVRDRLYIGGEWVEPSGDGTIDVINPSSEEIVGRIPEGTVEDADRAVRAARAAFEDWSRRTPFERAGFSAAIGAKLNERGDELAALFSTELGMPLTLSRMVQVGLPSVTFSSQPELAEQVQWEEEVGNSLVVREPAGRGGRDHALELSAQPDRQQGGAGPHRGLHGGAQAQRGRAPQRLRARGDLRGGRAARRGVQPGDRLRPGGGRGDRRPPRDGHGVVHRLDARGPAGVRAGGGQARVARARRKVAERDPRRRRPRARRDRRRGQVLPQLGPDLQRADPDAGAARAARAGRADRGRRGRVLYARRPVLRGHPPRTAGLGGPARTRARLHQAGRGRGSPAGHGRRGGARGPRRGLLRAPDRLLRRDPRDDASPRRRSSGRCWR